MKVSVTKITVISESVLRDEIIELIKRHGATGYTLTLVEGEGSRGVRASDWSGRNVRLEALVADPVADAILQELNDRYFEDYAVIAWLSEVKVLRGRKFGFAEEGGEGDGSGDVSRRD
ncbi:MAG: transcriptional regulator [Verrucomicrobiota bacterium]